MSRVDAITSLVVGEANTITARRPHHRLPEQSSVSAEWIVIENESTRQGQRFMRDNIILHRP